MRTATRLSPRRRTSVDAKTPYRTGGTPADSFDPITYASGEKLLQLSSDHAIAELRRRYDTFETVVGMIVSIRSSQPSGTSPPPHEPDKVKLHSLRELIGGYIPKDEVIRRLYECDPRLAMRYTRDEILDRPFRDICGLPKFLENYRYEKLDLGYDDAQDDDDEVADDDLPRLVDERTGGFSGHNDKEPYTTTKGKQTKRYKAVYGQKAVRLSAATRDRPTFASPAKSPSAAPSDKGRR
jgi:hypothetical protein